MQKLGNHLLIRQNGIWFWEIWATFVLLSLLRDTSLMLMFPKNFLSEFQNFINSINYTKPFMIKRKKNQQNTFIPVNWTTFYLTLKTLKQSSPNNRLSEKWSVVRFWITFSSENWIKSKLISLLMLWQRGLIQKDRDKKKKLEKSHM